MFCLRPREPVVPAGLCAQRVCRSCSEPVLLGVVYGRQPGISSADLLLWAWVARGWLIPGSGPELHGAGLSAALGLSPAWLVFQLLWSLFILGRPVCGLGPVRQAASVCSWCAPTSGFRCGHPAAISGVGGQLGFQLWAPSPLIWVRATRLQVCGGAVYPRFTIQGLRGEGRQRQRLLQRVL